SGHPSGCASARGRFSGPGGASCRDASSSSGWLRRPRASGPASRTSRRSGFPAPASCGRSSAIASITNSRRWSVSRRAVGGARRADVPTERTLIRGGYVLTMDDGLDDLPTGDVLVEGDRIAAVAPHVAVDDAHVIDARGHVVMPGFVDTHRHTWQTQMRGICADWTLTDYFLGMR